MSGRLAGKVAVVTGGARGQGASHVRAMIEQGAKVAITDICVELGGALAAELGRSALFLQHDVSKPDDWDRVVEAAEAAFGPIDILVNNAGVILLKHLEETSHEDYQRVIAVNQTSVFLGMKAVLPSMRRAGGGSIINISSVAANKGAPGTLAYAASKAAIGGMGRVAALELIPDNIRVNTVVPGIIRTPMVDAPDPERVTAMIAAIPVKRLGTTVEVSSLVVFLASDEASYSTGSEFIVDGGVLA